MVRTKTRIRQKVKKQMMKDKHRRTNQIYQRVHLVNESFSYAFQPCVSVSEKLDSDKILKVTSTLNIQQTFELVKCKEIIVRLL